MNRRVDISEDIKHYQNTLSYSLSKVDYSVGENLFMLPSELRQVLLGIIIKFSFLMVTLVWGKNDEVNEMPKITHQSTITHHELEKKPNITQAQKPTITHHELAKEPTHEDEKIVLVLALAGGFAI